MEREPTTKSKRRTTKKARSTIPIVPLIELPTFIDEEKRKNYDTRYTQFIVKHKEWQVPAAVFLDKEDADSGFTLLLTENPIDWFYDKYNVFDDDLTNSCLIMNISPKAQSSYIDNLSNSGCGKDIHGGWQVMEMVHEINRVFGIKKSSLQDYSRRYRDTTGDNIPLRLWSLIRTGKTWYEKHGFVVKDQKEKEEFFKLKTKDMASKYRDQHPELVEKLVGTKEELFHKALDKIMDTWDVSPLLEHWVSYDSFVEHKWSQKAGGRSRSRRRKTSSRRKSNHRRNRTNGDL